jgi:hypothetical protein
MKYLLVLSLVTSLLLSAELTPKSMIETSGNVQQITLVEGKIIAGTSVGTVETYKLSDTSKLSLFQFPKIKDFTGDDVAPKVFSVDMVGNSLLAVVQASNGARELYTIENGKSQVLIDAQANLFISKAKFIDKNRILVALLSNEFLLWDVKNKKEIYRIQPNPSHFSDFTLNENKTNSLLKSATKMRFLSINFARDKKIRLSINQYLRFAIFDRVQFSCAITGLNNGEKTVSYHIHGENFGSDIIPCKIFDLRKLEQ